jgi:transposase InsO family protein
MKAHSLLAHQTKHNKANRTERSKPRTTVPNTLWGMDMTKIMVHGWGWVYLHLVLDWGSKKLVGWHLSTTSKAKDWRAALDNALNQQFPCGKPPEHELKLVTDNGCQPTSTSFMKDCSTLKINQIFTSYNNPRGNADTERFIRTTKEGCVWLNEWFSLEQLEASLERFFNQYNGDFPHSSIGHLTPLEYESKYNREINNHLYQSSS